METLLLSKSIVVNTIDDLLRLNEKTIKLEKGIYGKYDTFQFDEIDIFKDSCSVIMRCDNMEHLKNIRIDFWFDIETRKILNYEFDSCVYMDESLWRIKILEKYISDLKDDEFVLKEAFFFFIFSFPTL